MAVEAPNKPHIPPFPAAVFAPAPEGNAHPETEKLRAALKQCEAERDREKRLFAEVLLREEQAAFTIEEKARERAGKIIAAATAEADRIRAQISAELAGAQDMLKNLMEAAAKIKQTVFDSCKSFDKSVLDLSDIITAQQTKFAPTEPENGAEDYLNKISELLRTVPGDDTSEVAVIDPSDWTEDPHRVFGK
jgi:vacuolar-type H+-ATPase subunit H